MRAVKPYAILAVIAVLPALVFASFAYDLYEYETLLRDGVRITARLHHLRCSSPRNGTPACDVGVDFTLPNGRPYQGRHPIAFKLLHCHSDRKLEMHQATEQVHYPVYVNPHAPEDFLFEPNACTQPSWLATIITGLMLLGTIVIGLVVIRLQSR